MSPGQAVKHQSLLASDAAVLTACYVYTDASDIDCPHDLNCIGSMQWGKWLGHHKSLHATAHMSPKIRYEAMDLQ